MQLWRPEFELVGISSGMFLLVPVYAGSPGQQAVKWLCVCVSGHKDNTDTCIL